MQQIFYVECPQIALTYPDTLEIGNTARWEGYQPFLGGLAFLNAFNMDTYLNLKPKSAEEEESGGTSATLWLVIAVIAVAGRDRGRAPRAPRRQAAGDGGVKRPSWGGGTAETTAPRR